MSSIEIDRQQTRPNNANTDGFTVPSRAAGVFILAAGSATLSGSIAGMNANEAKTPEEAVASVYFGEKETYITREDLPYAGSAGLGLALAATGLFIAMRRRQK